MFRTLLLLLPILGSSAQAALIAYWSLNETSGDFIDSGLGTPIATGSPSARETCLLRRQSSVPPGSYGKIQVSSEEAQAFGNAVCFKADSQMSATIHIRSGQDLKLRNLNDASSFTVMAWVRIDQFLPSPQDTQRILSIGGATDKERGWAFGIKNHNLIFTAIGVADKIQPIGMTWSPGSWHHIAMTYQKGLVSFYYDGKLLGSVTQSFEQTIDTVEVHLGGRAGKQDQLRGGLDEVKVFNTALTEERIRDVAIR